MTTKIANAFQIFLIAQNFHECSVPVGFKPTCQVFWFCGWLHLYIGLYFFRVFYNALIPYGRALSTLEIKKRNNNKSEGEQ